MVISMRCTNLYLEPEKLRSLKMLATNEDVAASNRARESIAGGLIGLDP
jgi:hypothetical protein